MGALANLEPALWVVQLDDGETRDDTWIGDPEAWYAFAGKAGRCGVERVRRGGAVGEGEGGESRKRGGAEGKAVGRSGGETECAAHQIDLGRSGLMAERRRHVAAHGGRTSCRSKGLAAAMAIVVMLVLVGWCEGLGKLQRANALGDSTAIKANAGVLRRAVTQISGRMGLGLVGGRGRRHVAGGGDGQKSRKREGSEGKGTGRSGGRREGAQEGRDGRAAGGFECETCGKALSTGGNLAAHMRTHSGEKPYACETCGKAFSEAGNLAVHMRTHSGEKPYACETCGKSFSLAGNLAKHMLTHSGERPHVCETCGRAFSTSGNLARHLRSHSGEKPHACETCGKAFSESSDLARHMSTHTRANSKLKPK
ncbi:hypothetical protein T484DRAFT_1663151 [Baffinella frigidus]|nr:hypothetical protein T484DRAFT_1663151 [Cryptophyta sp. CCMP2293]